MVNQIITDKSDWVVRTQSQGSTSGVEESIRELESIILSFCQTKGVKESGVKESRWWSHPKWLDRFVKSHPFSYPKWLSSVYPKRLSSSNPEWLTSCYPKWLTSGYPEWVTSSYAKWLTSGYPKWLSSCHPEWLGSQGVSDLNWMMDFH